MCVFERLTDLFDLADIQRFQDDFSGATQVAAVIVDDMGRPVTTPSHANRFCTLFAAKPETRGACQSSVLELLAACRQTARAAVHLCPHTGMHTAAVPLLFENRFLGCWLFGQVRTRQVSHKQLEAIARKLEIDHMEAYDILLDTPVLNEDMFTQVQNFVAMVSDIALQLGNSRVKAKKAAAELREATVRAEANALMLKRFVDASNLPMYISDFETGEVLMVNRAFCSQYNIPPGQAAGLPCWAAVGCGEGGLAGDCPHNTLLDEAGRPAGPATWTSYNPKLRAWVRSTAQAVVWENERLVQMVTQCDVSEERNMREQLARIAYYDKYTGLPNSEKLYADLQQTDYGDGTYMVAMHLSFMRNFTNVYGRQCSHNMMRSIAEWLGTLNGAGCTVYRAEGYAFCLLMRDAGLEQAKQTARKICGRFDESWPMRLNGNEIPYFCTVVVSVICMGPYIGEMDIQDLMQRTLHFAKSSKVVYIYDEEKDKLAKQHIEFELALKNAITNGMSGFYVKYQPIVDAHSGTWKGLEALCRCTCPGRGPVPPDKFIPGAEEQGLIGTLGEWVLERAIADCKALRLDEVDGFFLSVNVSPVQLMDEDFAGRVAGLLRAYAYPGARLNLEVTESTQLSFNQFTMSVIEQLRQCGVTLALDDFGTGYSSFNNLKNIPVQYMKTEQSFIRDIEQDHYLQYYYYVMSEIAHANHMRLIAEGVETKEQLNVVKSNGADYIQGYYYAKPLSREELAESLSHFTAPHECAPADHPRHVNINQWLNGKNAHTITPNLFKLLNRCMQALMDGQHLETSFGKALQIIGEHFDVGRAFACVEMDDKSALRPYEWYGSGMEALAHRFSGMEACRLPESLLEMFRADGMLLASDITRLPPDIHTILHPLGIRSIVLLPLRSDEQLVGFVGFCNEAYREWNPEEIIMLWNLSMIMSGSVRQENLLCRMDEKQRLLTTVLDSTGLNVMITDIDTDEILWINETLRTKYEIDPQVLGRKCYEVIEGRSERCPTCRVGQLVKNRDMGHISYERYNKRWNKTFVIYNSLFLWDTDKYVHVEYSLDITDHKKTQKQLEFFVTTDVMTGAMNRSTLMLRLRELLGWAHTNQGEVTLAFVDVDGMKQVNGQYGHLAGDNLLKSLVRALRASVRSSDLIGRIDGDEFAVVFPKCGARVANVRMTNAQRQFEKLNDGTLAPGQSFSFGLVGLNEMEYEDTAEFAHEMLEAAQRRMQRRKGRRIQKSLVVL